MSSNRLMGILGTVLVIVLIIWLVQRIL